MTERAAIRWPKPNERLRRAHHSTESVANLGPVTNADLPRSHPLNGGGQKNSDDQTRFAASSSTAGEDHAFADAQWQHVTPAPSTADGGQVRGDAQIKTAAVSTPREGHRSTDAQTRSADDLTPTEVNGHGRTDPQSRNACDLTPICDRLRELHRERQDLHRAEKSLTLQIKAKCRRLCDGDKKVADLLYAAISGKGEHDLAAYALAVSAPFLEARALLEGRRKQTEKAMEAEAKRLPISLIVPEIRGFALGSLAAIVGEAGNLSDYGTVSKLWKRMGLAVIKGERQRKKSGADAIEHGYSPSRRSVMWNVGQSLFKAQSQRTNKETGEVIREAGKYRQIYDARKAYELPRVESKGHAHNRATRYLEKQFLKDLWRIWNGA